LLSWSLDHVGFHAPSVDVLRDLLACAAFDRDDPYAEAYAGSLAADVPLKGLRIGLGRTPDVAIAPGVAARFEAAAAALRNAGAALVETALDLDLGRERRRGLLISEAEFASLRGGGLDAFLSQCSPELQRLVGWGARQPASKLAAAYAVFGEARLAARRIFAAADVLILPAAPQTAVAINGPIAENQADLTVWANVAGLPAVTIPMGLAEDGLPAGLQIIAARGADGLALDVAHKIETLLKTI
jgi:aspartyl-tRNA(Asn)/glutamyl-tRNA(Gln) amidotransferase subunit A